MWLEVEPPSGEDGRAKAGAGAGSAAVEGARPLRDRLRDPWGTWGSGTVAPCLRRKQWDIGFLPGYRNVTPGNHLVGPKCPAESADAAVRGGDPPRDHAPIPRRQYTCDSKNHCLWEPFRAVLLGTLSCTSQMHRGPP